MKRLSLQWRITLLTVLLIGAACVSMKLLLCASGLHYMDSIGSFIQDYGSAAVEGDPAFFDPELAGMNEDVTIVIHGAKTSFCTTNWYITAAVTVLSGVLAYFVSGRALRPLRAFASQVESVRPSNLADMKISEDVLPEFKQFSKSFNSMIDRLDEGFSAQRQFTGNAAHELRTPLALMQAQVELFSAEHPDMGPEEAAFLGLLQEQTEKMSQMTKTLLEMSELRSVPCDDRIELAPMFEEVLADLAPLAEAKDVSLERSGDALLIGSDTLMYRLVFNLVENAIRYSRPGTAVRVSACEEGGRVVLRIEDSGPGIPNQFRKSVFQPFFRVDSSRSREYGGVGLGLSLVWEIAALHSGAVEVEASSADGTVMRVELPVGECRSTV